MTLDMYNNELQSILVFILSRQPHRIKGHKAFLHCPVCATISDCIQTCLFQFVLASNETELSWRASDHLTVYTFFYLAESNQSCLLGDFPWAYTGSINPPYFSIWGETGALRSPS